MNSIVSLMDFSHHSTSFYHRDSTYPACTHYHQSHVSSRILFFSFLTPTLPTSPDLPHSSLTKYPVRWDRGTDLWNVDQYSLNFRYDQGISLRDETWNVNMFLN